MILYQHNCIFHEKLKTPLGGHGGQNLLYGKPWFRAIFKILGPRINRGIILTQENVGGRHDLLQSVEVHSK